MVKEQLARVARMDKLKHVPQCAARKLSAVSFRHSVFERHEIVAACKEYGGIVIQCAARKLSAVSFRHSAFERHEIVAACKEYGGIVIQDGMEGRFGGAGERPRALPARGTERVRKHAWVRSLAPSGQCRAAAGDPLASQTPSSSTIEHARRIEPDSPQAAWAVGQKPVVSSTTASPEPKALSGGLIRDKVKECSNPS
jgi:hypothetical protein